MREPFIASLRYTPPYDWLRIVRFFAARATPGVEFVDEASYRRRIDVNGAHGMLDVSHDPAGLSLNVSVTGKAVRFGDAIAARVARMFDLTADCASIDAHLARDPWFAPLVRATPGLRVPGAWSAFEIAVRAIVGQQVSVKAATTILGRLVDQLSVDSLFPTPAALADANLAGIGMPGRRIAALQGFARALADERVALDDPDADRAALRETLLALPGIGPWTVEYIAMRALRDPDAWPGTDLVLAQAMLARDATLAKASQQRARSDAWRPFRAYAALHLWTDFAAKARAARGG
jgi:DNA-3-methyladenine glycosylase II